MGNAFFSILHASTALVSADYLGKFYLFFQSLGSNISENTRIVSEIWTVYFRTNMSNGEKMFLQKTVKRFKIKFVTLKLRAVGIN